MNPSTSQLPPLPPIEWDALKGRFDTVQDDIRREMLTAQRNPDEIELLAVSKGQPASKIEALTRLGQWYFGENYAQELLEKANSLASLPIRWSFIGALQSNKIRRIVEVAHEIQTVTDLRHARLIAKAAEEFNKNPFPIYIEVNVSNETSKGGIPLSTVQDFYHEIQRDLPAVQVMGLMAIPAQEYADPPAGEPVIVPEIYQSIRSASRSIGAGKLSLGMSGDRRMAIEAGTDLLRIGTAIFGSRQPRSATTLQKPT